MLLWCCHIKLSFDQSAAPTVHLYAIAEVGMVGLGHTHSLLNSMSLYLIQSKVIIQLTQSNIYMDTPAEVTISYSFPDQKFRVSFRISVLTIYVFRERIVCRWWPSRMTVRVITVTWWYDVESGPWQVILQMCLHDSMSLWPSPWISSSNKWQ